MAETPLTVLGWREWLCLPDLDLPWMVAKIDTGARSSALHAFEVHTLRRDGVDYASFLIHPLRKRDDIVVQCEAPLLDERQVTDSGGHTELRPVIQSRLVAGPVEKLIELTLTNRDTMAFRMLLGRTAMNTDFMVNPALSWQLPRPKKDSEQFYAKRQVELPQ